MWASVSSSQTIPIITPLTGHYPPGLSGIRGAATPDPGVSLTNFNRFFTNLELHDAGENNWGELDGRYANITMITWTSHAKVLGMSYGALMGIPFVTGNLRPSGGDFDSNGFGLGDIMLTPVSLYGKSNVFDYQLQFTVWSASGHFEQGSTENRGTGFWSLMYSIGAVYYPDARRDAWSISWVIRVEQNFEQKATRIQPGDDIISEWAVGRVVQVRSHALDVGVSGFFTLQFTTQEGGGDQDLSHYRYEGLGPEANLSITDNFAVGMRVQWEFDAHNAVRGDNYWLILNYQPSTQGEKP